MIVVARVFSLAIGYVFGLLQTGYLYGRSKGIDIRNEGSGNAGTTNSLRVLGWKAGLITFLGDLFKAIIVVLLARCSGTIFRFTCTLRAARESLPPRA
jgi:glycerol-3-phosphate acyltransferase PlsY